MTNALDGARMKLDRARTHLRCLADEIERYRESRPYGCATKIEGTIASAEAVITAEPPASLSCIIGDCVTNIRASLDYVAWELATKNPPHPLTERQERGIYFPLSADLVSFNGSPTVALLRGPCAVPAPAMQEIELVQPFQAGFEVLGHLPTLVNEDKHRSLLLAAGFVAGMGKITLNYGNKGWYNPGGISIGINLEPFGAKASDDLKSQVSTKLEGDATIFVTFRNSDIPQLPADGLVEAIIGCAATVIARLDPFV
jgi:hypothetical protein